MEILPDPQFDLDVEWADVAEVLEQALALGEEMLTRGEAFTPHEQAGIQDLYERVYHVADPTTCAPIQTVVPAPASSQRNVVARGLVVPGVPAVERRRAPPARAARLTTTPANQSRLNGGQRAGRSPA